MFFGKRKNIEAETQELMKQVKNQLEKVSESLEEGQKMQQQVFQTLEGFGTNLKRHDMSLEDLLDEWSERTSDEKEIKEQIWSLKDTEEKLLKLFEIYQEQFWAIHLMASELGDEWKKQTELAVRNTENQIRLCGNSPVDAEAGKKIDYAVHEVLELLEYVKQYVSDYMGEEITRAVISVPAYFDDIQRKSTVTAGAKAGLEVERILNEPTAAALSYGLDHMEEESHILVYDLGGETFDVTLPEIDKVILVGGSTRVPLIARDIREYLNMEPEFSVHPDFAVAEGAAIQAAIIEGLIDNEESLVECAASFSG